MKKNLTGKLLEFILILALILIFILSFITLAKAEGDVILEEEVVVTENIIPKPEYLPGPASDSYDPEKSKAYFTETLLPGLTKGIIALAGGVAFIVLIIGGIRYIASFGNEEAQTGAKNMIIWSIVGLLIAILSYAIVSIIVSII